MRDIGSDFAGFDTAGMSDIAPSAALWRVVERHCKPDSTALREPVLARVVARNVGLKEDGFLATPREIGARKMVRWTGMGPPRGDT